MASCRPEQCVHRPRPCLRAAPPFGPHRDPSGELRIHTDLLTPWEGQEQALQLQLPASPKPGVCLCCDVSGESHPETTFTLQRLYQPSGGHAAPASAELTAVRPCVPGKTPAENPGINEPVVLSLKNLQSRLFRKQSIWRKFICNWKPFSQTTK